MGFCGRTDKPVNIVCYIAGVKDSKIHESCELGIKESGRVLTLCLWHRTSCVYSVMVT